MKNRLFVASVLMVVVLLLVASCGATQPTATAVPPTPDPAIATLQAQADQVAANKAVMDKFIELFTTGAWDQFDQVIAADCVLHYPGGVDVVGLDAMVAGWQEFFPKLKDLKFTAQGQASEGDLLMEFLTFEATYEGEYMGQQISGVPIKYNQVEMQRFEDGKIVEWWVENDRLWMAEQLGAELVPPPPTGITVTFDGDRCVYHGPERVPAGQIPLTLDVRDQSAPSAYAVSAYTLEEGKTIEDLRAWTSADSSPLWGNFHGRVDATGGTAQETTIILFEGPFFLSCVTNPPNEVTDVLGPIEIEPAGSK